MLLKVKDITQSWFIVKNLFFLFLMQSFIIRLIKNQSSGNETYCGDPFEVYTNMESLCRTPEMNIIL